MLYVGMLLAYTFCILKMCKMSSNEIMKMGENSNNCYKKYFDREMLFEKVENIFNDMVNDK